MEQESLEYTKLPAAETAKKPGRASTPASAANPAVAAAVVTCVAAGALAMLHAPHTPLPRQAAAPAAEPRPADVHLGAAPARAASRPIRIGSGAVPETRAASPLPLPLPEGARPESSAPSVTPPAEASVPDAPGGSALKPGEVAPAVALAAARSLPAWAAAAGVQRWIWPKSVGARVSPDGLGHRRLLSWDPQQPLEEQRAQYELLYDGPGLPGARVQRGMAPVAMDIEQVRAQELKALAQKMQAVSYKDVRTDPNRPMAELTFAGGRKIVVPYDPLVFDLRGTGVKTDDRRVLFDLYGSGQADKLQWMSNLDGGTGILVFDADGSGKSGKTGAEVFGDRTDLAGIGRPTGFANGFQALRALVEKAVDEGVLPRETARRGVLESKDLAALEKAYGLRLKVGGFNEPSISLAKAGISAIALSNAPTERLEDFDGRSNSLVVQPGAVFLRADGTTGTYMNVWLKANDGAPKLATRKFMYAP